jgi:hypothetical protein
MASRSVALRWGDPRAERTDGQPRLDQAPLPRALRPCAPACNHRDDGARFYYDLVYNSLNEAARRALEAMMKSYDYQSDFAKKYVAEGRAEGRKEGERALLLRLLRTRFGELPATAMARVESAEIAVLERWGERVLSAKTLAEVLDEPS